MEPRSSFQIKGQENLPEELSHLLVELARGGLPFDLKEYLARRGVAVVKESYLSDELGRTWWIISVNQPEIGELVLELVEKGLSGNLQGINAKKRVKPASP